MRFIIKILCKILKWIEEIMKLIPTICGSEPKIHLPSFCADLPYFTGLKDATIPQGTDFDLLDGVKAFDADGQEIPYDVTPSEVASCVVGVQTFTYSTEGYSKERNITVTAIGDPAISGIDEAISVGKGVEFDPLEGVTAVDGNGNTLTVTVTQIA